MALQATQAIGNTNESLIRQFEFTRRQSEQFCAPLHVEDFNLQAVAETSPPKWHLAHTTWFFETFVLKPFIPNFKPWHPQFEYLFNSYYNGVGEQFPRPKRGLLSRPSLEDVLEYRHHTNQAVTALLGDDQHPNYERIRSIVELGIHHEQQHQELFFTDIKYNFSFNPLAPALTELPGYDQANHNQAQAVTQTWQTYEGGLTHIGCRTNTVGSYEFCFDNETPRHRVFLEPFRLANRLTTNGEYLAFIEDNGYHRPELWLADGWAQRQAQDWQAPLYWRQHEGEWYEFTLHGLKPLDLDRPVSHVSAYEADAFARWCGARLPTEFEWEAVAQHLPVEGQFVAVGEYHPRAAQGAGLQQVFGTLWEWTSSAYSPYPGFKPAAGAIGEYNGKFMCNQLVLRGGSCVSSQSHLRASYRNFFYPPDRWQFTGIRLANS